MKALELKHPAGLDNLHLVDMTAPGAPQAGEIQVRLHASSLSQTPQAKLTTALNAQPHAHTPAVPTGASSAAAGFPAVPRRATLR